MDANTGFPPPAGSTSGIGLKPNDGVGNTCFAEPPRASDRQENPSVGTTQSKAQEIVTQFLTRSNKLQDPLTPDLHLYGEGLELDSLETAELSALLEDELGSDPFSAGATMPETVGDVLAFYETAN